MLRIVVISLLMPTTFLIADEPDAEKLAAPAGWGGETIALPPVAQPLATLVKGRLVSPSSLTMISALPAAAEPP